MTLGLKKNKRLAILVGSLLIVAIFIITIMIFLHKGKIVKPNEIQLRIEGTCFWYEEKEYDLKNQDELVYESPTYEVAGENIILESHLGKNGSYYGIFNTKAKEFEKSIEASHIAYWDNDISTLIYCVDNELYDFYDHKIEGYTLQDDEYIYDISLEQNGKQLLIEIAKIDFDDELRTVTIEL